MQVVYASIKHFGFSFGKNIFFVLVLANIYNFLLSVLVVKCCKIDLY